MKLITRSIPGNLEQATETLNDLGYAEFMVQMQTDGYKTAVVLRVPDDFVGGQHD